MKSFIVAALLVAAVAGQSLDTFKYQKDAHPLFKFDRETYPMVRDMKLNNMIETPYPYGEWDYDTTTTTYLQLEEIMAHPLFREYMKLPLFRQYWSYPMFQKYVCSMYFQKFWEHPIFQQYFVNPALFYKYIYPIVQLFKYEMTTRNTFANGDWIWNKNAVYGYDNEYYPYNKINGGYEQYNYENRDFVHYLPTYCQYNTIYCKALYEKMYNHMNYMIKMRTMMPYGQQDMDMETYTNTPMVYNPFYARMFQKYFNRYPTTYETEYDNMIPYTFNKERNNKVHFNNDMTMNTYETPKMMDDAMFYPKYETIRPYVHAMGAKKTFDKKFMPETVIKA